jgi:hypothetical protein
MKLPTAADRPFTREANPRAACGACVLPAVSYHLSAGGHSVEPHELQSVELEPVGGVSWPPRLRDPVANGVSAFSFITPAYDASRSKASKVIGDPRRRREERRRIFGGRPPLLPQKGNAQFGESNAPFLRADDRMMAIRAENCALLSPNCALLSRNFALPITAGWERALWVVRGNCAALRAQ